MYKVYMNLQLKYKFKFHLKNCNVKTKWHKKKKVLTKVSEYIKNKPKKSKTKPNQNKTQALSWEIKTLAKDSNEYLTSLLLIYLQSPGRMGQIIFLAGTAACQRI